MPISMTRADLRLGHAWSRQQRLKNAFIRISIRGALLIADRLPWQWLLAAGRSLGRLSFAILRHERRSAERRIEAAQGAALLPASPHDLARACFERAGLNLARCLLLRRAGFDPAAFTTIPVESRATLERALAQRRGVIFISAHLGPFEWIPALVEAMGHAPAIVVRSSYDPGLDPIVDQHRLARRTQVIHRGTPGTLPAILRALRANRPVGFLIDLPARVRSAESAFLGPPLHLPIGPLHLAQRLKVPVAVGYLRRSSDQARPYLLHIEVVQPADALTMQRSCLATLERGVLAAPAEWLWMASRGPRVGF